MKPFWKILIGILLILLVVRFIRYLKRVRESLKRLKAAERDIDAEVSAIRKMDMKEAEQLGRRVLIERATLEPWSESIPANIQQALDKLDHSIRSLFVDYRRWLFAETGTEFNVDYLTAKLMNGGYQVALDKSIGQRLVVKPGSPVIFELNEDGRVIEEYPSVYHYFLLAEKD